MSAVRVKLQGPDRYRPRMLTAAYDLALRQGPRHSRHVLGATRPPALFKPSTA
jgi:hypothetical protein